MREGIFEFERFVDEKELITTGDIKGIFIFIVIIQMVQILLKR